MTDITAPTHTTGILQQPQPQEDDFNNDFTDDFEVDLFDDAFENKVVKSKEVKDKEVAETEIVNKVINDSIEDDLVDGLVDESVGESIDELLADEHSESLYEPINEPLNQPPLADELSNEPSDESSELTESTELSSEQTDEADNKPELPDDFLEGIDTGVPKSDKHNVLTYKELEEAYIRKRELQKKDLQKKSEKVKSDSVIEFRIQDDEESSLFDRLFFGILMAFVFSMIGFILDGLITVVRSVAGHGNGSLVWMFTPIFMIVGMFVGVLSGRNAGANAIDFINIGHSANTRVDDPSIAHDILRGIGIAIAIFAVIWIVLMIVS